MEIKYDDCQRSGQEAGIDPRQDLPTDPQRDNPGLQVRQDLGNSGSRFGKSNMEQNKGQERRDFYVYFLRRPDKEDHLGTGNGQPFYIGKGTNDRVKQHRWEAGALLHNPGRKIIKITIIHKLWKQGLDFIEDIYLDNLTEQEAIEWEKQAIIIYGRIDLENGCLANLTDGGEGGKSGCIVSQETRDKIGNSHRGKIISPEHIEKLRLFNTGRTQSEESNKKRSIKLKGRKLPPKTKEQNKKHGELIRIKWQDPEYRERVVNSHKGHKRTEEAKRKTSEKLKGIPKSEEWKQKIGDGNRGKIRTPETIEKMRIARRKRPAPSEETKRKTRETLKELYRNKKLQSYQKKEEE